MFGPVERFQKDEFAVNGLKIVLQASDIASLFIDLCEYDRIRPLQCLFGLFVSGSLSFLLIKL